ncbi:DNase I-like protein [Mycena olivaceomarginata]|nr:DNase I-like protein [Mycena olivaceomarginata]
MSALESSIRALLRPSDQVKVVLEALVVPPPNNAGTPDPSPGSSSRSQIDDTRSKRILAVVAHSDGPNTQEEGSVFILKWKAAGRAFDQSDILRVFPVFGGFSITMAQVRRETWPMGESSPGLLSLTITQGDIQDLEPLTLATQHVQTLRDVLAECKRLKEIAGELLQLRIMNRRVNDHQTRRQPLLHRSPRSRGWCRTPQNVSHYQRCLGSRKTCASRTKPLHTRLSAAFAGEAGDDFTDIVRIRDEWIRSRVRETSSKGKQNLRVRIGTFNVNGNLPSQDLSPWVGGNGNAPAPISDEPKPEAAPAPSRVVLGEKDSVDADADPGLDLLVLGFQELDLSTEALIYSTSTLKEEAWCTAAFAALGARAELYEKLVGMLIVVIVRRTLRPCFSEIKTSAAGTGIMGLMNPGPTVLTFVNAHLAAFDEMVEKRNADFHDLAKRLRFDLGPTLPEGATAPVPVTCNIFESDALFWMGDLNYRIDVADADVRIILAAEEWAESRYETLLQYDQLKSAVRANKAFDMFSEGPITHLPTYRFNCGIAEGRSRLRPETASCMDRSCALHLKRLRPRAAAELYRPSANQHRVTIGLCRPSLPSRLTYTISPPRRLPADKLYRQLNGLEDAHEDTNARINLKIMNAAVELGKVSYKQTVTQQVGIRNIGKVPCAYRLVPIDPESSVHPDWLKVEPMTALLLPDELAYITLTAYVDNDSASRLNIDHKALECTLILHTVMGKDHFIAVTAEYVPTCFANTLSRLTLLPGPIRSLKSRSELLAADRAINAPREIMRLVNWMMGPDLHLDNVFVSPADETKVATIRECLDTGADFPFSPDPKDDQAPVAFGETLFRLLDSLPEPLIPVELHLRCSEATNRYEAFELLDALPPTAVNVWISVTAFLHFVCQSSADPDAKTQKNRYSMAYIYPKP